MNYPNGYKDKPTTIGELAANYPPGTLIKVSPEQAITSAKHDHMKKAISPDHYKGKTLEVIDVIEDFDLDLHQGSVVQYVIRFKKKDGLQDLKKAKWYIERMIQKWEKEHPPF